MHAEYVDVALVEEILDDLPRARSKIQTARGPRRVAGVIRRRQVALQNRKVCSLLLPSIAPTGFDS